MRFTVRLCVGSRSGGEFSEGGEKNLKKGFAIRKRL